MLLDGTSVPLSVQVSHIHDAYAIFRVIFLARIIINIIVIVFIIILVVPVINFYLYRQKLAANTAWGHT